MHSVGTKVDRLFLTILGSLILLALAWPARADGDAPPDVDRVLGGLASSRPEVRRAGLTALEHHLPLAGGRAVRAVRALRDVLARRPASEGALAVGLLARLPGDPARDAWLEALDPEADPRVFQAAVLSSAHRRADAAAAKTLLRLAGDARADESTRALALEALGVIGGAAARLVLLRPAGDATAQAEPWLLASGRALGLRYLGGRAGGEALLDLLEHPHAAPRVHAWEVLVHLTRAMLPLDAEAWRAWWAAHPDALTPDALAATAPESGDRYTPPAPAHVPRYYGVPIARPSSHVVFCLDVSQSMYGRGIEQARSELRRTLLSFPTTHAFDVIAFNERLHPFADGLVPAHPVVKARALAWLEALETISYTNLYDAVETAFGYGGIGRRARSDPSRLDAVFLLSDGAPNRGRYRRDDKVVEEIAALSRGRIPVHAVAAGEEVFPLLRRIAGETGGRFVDAFEFE